MGGVEGDLEQIQKIIFTSHLKVGALFFVRSVPLSQRDCYLLHGWCTVEGIVVSCKLVPMKLVKRYVYMRNILLWFSLTMVSM